MAGPTDHVTRTEADAGEYERWRGSQYDVDDRPTRSEIGDDGPVVTKTWMEHEAECLQIALGKGDVFGMVASPYREDGVFWIGGLETVDATRALGSLPEYDVRPGENGTWVKVAQERQHRYDTPPF